MLPPSIEATFIKVGIEEIEGIVAGEVEVLTLFVVKAKSIEHGSPTVIHLNI